MRSRWYLAKAQLPSAVPSEERHCFPRLVVDGELQQPLGVWQLGEQVAVVVSLPDSLRAGHVILPHTDGAPAQIVEPVSLTAISRIAAFVRMLPGTPRAKVGRLLVGATRGLLIAAQALVRSGKRDAMYMVASRYQKSLSDNPSATAYAGPLCVVRTAPFSASRDAYWVASHQLVKSSLDGDGRAWRATGADPQFLLSFEHVARALPGGWYHVRFNFNCDAKGVESPALYPDYGSGMLEYDAIRLPEPDENGCIEAVILLRSEVKSLRLDPTAAVGEFRLHGSYLRRVGRISALLRMLRPARLANGSWDWRGASLAAARFGKDALSQGISPAAHRLYRGSAFTDEQTYARWVQLYDTLAPDYVQTLQPRVEALSYKPLVSILLPVYETSTRWLRSCLDSVLGQAYPHWELCVVDDASPSERVGRTLAEYARKDSRIKVYRRTTNGHIAAASNDALSMAEGGFIALLDHDDELRPHSLLEMVEALQCHPDAGLLYSDEDKIDERGRRFQPNFKPDWNPDLLLAQNYICHFAVMRADVVRRAGGFRQGYEGSQDHDLFLRCTELLEDEAIIHIPRILYHWRAIEGSTALHRGAKDYAAEAGLRAVSDHLSRAAPGATVSPLAHGHFRVHWPLPRAVPKVSIIVPTRDRVELLRSCVESVASCTDYPDFEIIVVDNQSREDETLCYLRNLEETGRARVLRFDAPFNYSAINNYAVNEASGGVLCLLNNDVEIVQPEWLRELVAVAVRPGIGAVGPMLYFPDRTIQHAGVILGIGGIANHIYSGHPAGFPGHGARALVAQNLSAVTGACLVVARDRYMEVGGLDEELQVAFNDVDFCLRLATAGYRNAWTPFAELVHHESATRGRDEQGPSRERFIGEVRLMENRWREILEQDPAYNPNLSLNSTDGVLAFPPRVRPPRPHIFAAAQSRRYETIAARP